MEDYRDRLLLDSELASSLLGPPALADQPEVELRQCLFLNIAGALLRSQLRKPPRVPAVQSLAHRMRAQMQLSALEALQALGLTPAS
eukprot:975623-Lingulodinium_polyedra.AAC.1